MSPNDSVLCPLDSAKLISEHSKHVSICETGVSKTSELLFESLKSKRYCINVWKEHKLHPKNMTKETVDWIFLLDCLNFSFWVEDDVTPWAVEFEGEIYHGYWALCAGINRALKVISKTIFLIISQGPIGVGVLQANLVAVNCFCGP